MFPTSVGVALSRFAFDRIAICPSLYLQALQFVVVPLPQTEQAKRLSSRGGGAQLQNAKLGNTGCTWRGYISVCPCLASLYYNNIMDFSDSRGGSNSPDNSDDEGDGNSSQGSSSNTKENNKYCDCCYCEFFGHAQVWESYYVSTYYITPEYGYEYVMRPQFKTYVAHCSASAMQLLLPLLILVVYWSTVLWINGTKYYSIITFIYKMLYNMYFGFQFTHDKVVLFGFAFNCSFLPCSRSCNFTYKSQKVQWWFAMVF